MTLDTLPAGRLPFWIVRPCTAGHPHTFSRPRTSLLREKILCAACLLSYAPHLLCLSDVSRPRVARTPHPPCWLRICVIVTLVRRHPAFFPAQLASFPHRS